ncbi:MAG: type IX secretion system membrane protein PorP/SprF [Cytophagales bacterium]
MKKKIKTTRLLIFIWIVQGVLHCSAQHTVLYYPTEISQTSINQFYQNPSSCDTSYKFVFDSFSKVYLGPFANNNYTFANFNYRINSQSESKFQYLGALFSYDKEGSFLHKYRFYVNYSYNIHLNQSWVTGFGARIGGFSYRIGKDDYPIGGNDNALDAALGIHLKNKSFDLGVSLFQIPQSKLQPFVEITKLAQYISVQSSYTKNLNHYLKNVSNLNINFYQQKTPSVSLISGIIINDQINLTAIYRLKKSIGFMFGLENIKIGNDHFKLYVSYDIQTNRSIKSNSVEFSLNYRILNKSKGYLNHQKL